MEIVFRELNYYKMGPKMSFCFAHLHKKNMKTMVTKWCETTNFHEPNYY